MLEFAIVQLRSASFSMSTKAPTSKLVEQLRWLGSLGIETVFGYVVGAEQIRPIEIIGREVISAIQGASAGAGSRA